MATSLSAGLSSAGYWQTGLWAPKPPPVYTEVAQVVCCSGSKTSILVGIELVLDYEGSVAPHYHRQSPLAGASRFVRVECGRALKAKK